MNSVFDAFISPEMLPVYEWFALPALFSLCCIGWMIWEVRKSYGK